MAKQRNMPEIEFYDAAGTLLKRCRLDALPFREEAVLRLSMEFFQDPEPCMIHRSAVISRVVMELLDYFQQQGQTGQNGIELSNIPPRLADFLQVPSSDRVVFLSGEN